MENKEKPPGRIEQAIVAYAWRASGGMPLGMPDRMAMRVDDSLFTPTATAALMARLVPLPVKVTCRDEALMLVAHCMVRIGPQWFNDLHTPWEQAHYGLYVKALEVIHEHEVLEWATSLLNELFM